MKNWPDANAPWVGSGHDEAWTAAVAAPKWTRRGTKDYVDWLKALPCPRCGHNMSVVVAPGAYRDAAPRDTPMDAVAAMCNCQEAHAGRPEKRPRGCGYGGWIPRPSKETTA